jgi:hypothetical protein
MHDWCLASERWQYGNTLDKSDQLKPAYQNLAEVIQGERVHYT